MLAGLGYSLFFTISAALEIILGLLLVVAFYVLAERKVLGSLQRRRGPSAVGFWGIAQPLCDGLKLVLKEIITPSKSTFFIFFLAPTLLLILAFTCWAFIPFGYTVFFIDSDLSLLFVLGFSALGVYGVLGAGWSSFSRYALLGGLRSVAQLISYELNLGLMVLPAGLVAGSLNLIDIVSAQSNLVWFCVPFCPIFVLFVISGLAETNRTPFDLPEAEAELVAGFNVEYSATTFAMFFLAEYANMILMSMLGTLLFLGGWGSSYLFFMLKLFFWIFFFILVRGALPRYRHDQLMFLGWKNFLVFVFSFFIFTLGVLASTDALPYNQTVVWGRIASLLVSQAGVFEGF